MESNASLMCCSYLRTSSYCIGELGSLIKEHKCIRSDKLFDEVSKKDVSVYSSGGLEGGNSMELSVNNLSSMLRGVGQSAKIAPSEDGIPLSIEA
jgi:hypothetical protein